jgi:hypothetical protein
MNKRQKVVILAGLFVFVLAGLFPPWSFQIRFSGRMQAGSLGLSLLFSPPDAPMPSLRGMTAITLDSSRLFVEWIVIVVVTCTCLWMAKVKKEKLEGRMPAEDTRSSAKVDPEPKKWEEILSAGSYQLECGICDFISWSKKMVDEFGDEVKPYLEQIWYRLQSQRDMQNHAFEKPSSEESNPVKVKNNTAFKPIWWGIFTIIVAAYMLVSGLIIFTKQTPISRNPSISAFSAVIQGLLWAVTGIAMAGRKRMAIGFLWAVVALSALGAIVHGLILYDVILCAITLCFALAFKKHKSQLS